MPGQTLEDAIVTSAPFPRPAKAIGLRSRRDYSPAAVAAARKPSGRTSDARAEDLDLSPPSIIPPPEVLPPTPPHQILIAYRDGRSDEPVLSKLAGSAMADDKSPFSTPINPRSPPTPDVTPPRNLLRSSDLSSPQTQSHPSPRTASFKTAPEYHYSSDEEPSAARLARLTSAKRPPRPPLAFVGPVLEPIVSPEPQLSLQRPRHEALDREAFGAFDGAWNGHHDRLDGPFDDGEARRVDYARDPSPSPPSSLTRADLRDLPTRASLRERVALQRQRPLSPELDDFGQQIAWPSMVDDMLLELSPQSLDFRRLSSVSGASTIVEAFVVDDSPPVRRRRLRHKGKDAALRSHADPTVGRSVSLPLRIRSPPADAEPASERSRLHRSPAMAPSSSLREAGESREPKPRLDPVPAPAPIVAVSKRPPSEGPAQAASSKTRSWSMTATDHDRDRPGYFDLPRAEKRHTSGSPSAARPGERGRFVRQPPVVPPRSSSLSAPTTRHGSRATSLTAASLRSHNSARAIERPHQRALSLGAVGWPDDGVRARGEAGSDGRYLSPPSAETDNRSDQASSPEALEVSEARAVNIYPHNNRSLVVVEQQSRPVSRDRPSQAPAIAVTPAEPAVAEPVTPIASARPSALADSPLKHPREPPLPPQPPAIQLIAPTPLPPTPAADADRRLTMGEPRGPRGPLSMVKRALLPRRYSESFASSLARWTGVDGSTQSNKRRKESKLSPFWLPRGFWDDVEVEGDEAEEEFLDRGRSEILEAPRLGRRVSNPLPRREDVAIDRDGSLGPRSWASTTTTTTGSRKRRRISPMPGLAVEIEYVGFREVSQRLRDARAARVERARERERNKIKGRISPPRAILEPPYG